MRFRLHTQKCPILGWARWGHLKGSLAQLRHQPDWAHASGELSDCSKAWTISVEPCTGHAFPALVELDQSSLLSQHLRSGDSSSL